MPSSYTLSERVIAFAQSIGTDVGNMLSSIGQLTGLATSHKSSLVGAINEVHGMAQSGGGSGGSTVSYLLSAYFQETSPGDWYFFGLSPYPSSEYVEQQNLGLTGIQTGGLWSDLPAGLHDLGRYNWPHRAAGLFLDQGWVVKGMRVTIQYLQAYPAGGGNVVYNEIDDLDIAIVTRTPKTSGPYASSWGLGANVRIEQLTARTFDFTQIFRNFFREPTSLPHMPHQYLSPGTSRYYPINYTMPLDGEISVAITPTDVFTGNGAVSIDIRLDIDTV